MPAKKSSHLKRTQGTARKGRQKNTPQPEPGAQRPDWLSPRAAELWGLYAPDLIRDGLLTARSAHWLAQACDAQANQEELARLITPEYLEESASAKSYPTAVALYKNYGKMFSEASAKLGLSPSDWQKLDIAPPEGDEAAERFFGPRLAEGGS